MLVIHLECVLVLAGLHEGVGEGGDGGQVVVDGPRDVQGCHAFWQREGLGGDFVIVAQIDA